MPGCRTYSDLRIQYPRAIVGLWITTSDALSDEWAGYVANMEASGTAAVDPLVEDTKLLSLVSDLSELYDTDDVLLDDIEFFGYDPILPASTEQDTETINEIISSQSHIKSYGFSRIRFGMVGGTWQPNYFRPYFAIDGVTVLNLASTRERTSTGGALRSHRGIGLPLPYCHTCEVALKSVTDIQVRARLAQYVQATGKVQQYIVVCRATFRMK